MKTVDCHFPGTPSATAEAVLRSMTQPLTAKQLSCRLQLPLHRINVALSVLRKQALVRCLNPGVANNLLYWLTPQGKQTQRQLGATLSHDYPAIDWALYASVCFSQRSEVIRTLQEAMQPAQIRRKAAFRKPGIRLSANNVRDVIYYLEGKRVVQRIQPNKKGHPRYELTDVGQHLRRLLLNLEAFQ